MGWTADQVTPDQPPKAFPDRLHDTFGVPAPAVEVE